MAGKPPKRKARARGCTFNPSREGLEPLLGAAYLMMDRAYVRLSGDRKKALTVEFFPKDPAVSAASLEKEFRAELEGQKLRWQLARHNQPIREYIAEQAVLLATGRAAPPPPQEGAADQLTDEQRSEIEKLIAEVEDEIKTMNQKKAVADPKNIKASWEERRESGA
jgi:His-Xaa-Ser system protein HxsD